MLIGRVEPANYAGNTVEGYFSVEVCVRHFQRSADFRSIAIKDQTCWPFSKGPRAITFSKIPSSVAGF